MSWYTCTPVSFGGGADFFCRDSGLICKGIQSLGLECKSIMPLPEQSEDIKEDLIRTDFKNLTQPDWWKNIDATHVVLYSWGHPKYKKVAEAIKNSGAKVFINLDSAGILFPRVTPHIYLSAIMGRQIRLHGPILGSFTGLIYCLVYYSYVPFLREPGRIAHLKNANAIGCITPNALTLWRLWARKYAPELVERMHVVPNPVADYIKYDTKIEKQDCVIAVGRWDYIECKRPLLLAKVIEQVARVRNKTIFRIYGTPGKILTNWHTYLPTDIKNRVYLYGKLNHLELIDAYIQSRVGLCTSSHEGSHVASEEALCAGASIVAPLRPELNSMLWYVSHDSGRLSVDDSSKCLAETLLLELESWDCGERDPVSISSYWFQKLSVQAVSRRIKKILK